MMWNTIANFKENLNQIALDVQDAAEELEIYRSSAGEDSSVSDRRISHRFAQSKSMLHSPTANGIDSGYKTEIEQYKAEIKRLQASEDEIKALSVNYAALLKEKEEQLSRLHEENGSLRQNLEATNSVRSASRNENLKTSTSNPNVLKDFMSGKTALRNIMSILLPGVNAIISDRTNQVLQVREEMSRERSRYLEAMVNAIVEEYQHAVSVANFGGIRDVQGLYPRLGLKSSPQVYESLEHWPVVAEASKTHILWYVILHDGSAEDT
ncbi:hypothetical protein HHK36_027625 [Tetracentron sinense]|uniref:Uncharacterized protein n=1 Tax=Tetracentron sinense TaxID=13715 RepID=A0A835D1E6_TETSI|nr:hypothetical protein HHK36_027625 [Tetracentron sinense]